MITFYLLQEKFIIKRIILKLLNNLEMVHLQLYKFKNTVSFYVSEVTIYILTWL